MSRLAIERIAGNTYHVTFKIRPHEFNNAPGLLLDAKRELQQRGYRVIETQIRKPRGPVLPNQTWTGFLVAFDERHRADPNVEVNPIANPRRSNPMNDPLVSARSKAAKLSAGSVNQVAGLMMDEKNELGRLYQRIESIVNQLSEFPAAETEVQTALVKVNQAQRAMGAALGKLVQRKL